MAESSFNSVPSFESLSLEEMNVIQGAGDVQAETTPALAGFTVGLAGGVVFSIKSC